MIDRQEAIAILQEHINTYRYQTTDKGWEQMVRTGIVGIHHSTLSPCALCHAEIFIRAKLGKFFPCLK